MEGERILSLEILIKFFKSVEIKDDVINQIVEVCKSIEDLLPKVNEWSKLVKKEELIKIVKGTSCFQHAGIEAEEFRIIESTQESDISFKKYFDYAEKYGKKVDEEIKKFKQEIYKLAFETYLESRNSCLVVNKVTGGASLV